MIKAIIFDMDGVLMDSEKYQYKAFIILFKKHKLKYKKLEFRWVGKTAKENIASILKENNSNLNCGKLITERERIYLNLIKSGLKPRRGVANLLQHLKKNKLKIGLASQSRRKNINYVLSILGLKKYFTSIVSSEDVRFGKPNPDIYLQASKKLGLLPEECIAIEDSPIGIKSAVSAGFFCVGLVTDYRKADELKEACIILHNIVNLSIHQN